MRRVALGFVTQPYPIEEILMAAQRAERMGYESVWLTEDIWSGRDSFSILACMALNTERMRLGTAVIGMYSRHPLMIAMTLNALSELAPGRLILGIGAGMSWKPLLSSVETAVSPLATMRHTVSTIRDLLLGQKVAWGEKTLNLTVERKCFFGSLQPSSWRVPIYIGAIGPRMTQLAGEIGDGLMLEMQMRRGQLPDRLKRVAEGADLAKRDPSSIDIAKLIVTSVSEDGRVHENALGYVAKEVARLEQRDIQRLGFDPERVRRFKERYLREDCRSALGLLSPEMVSTYVAAGTQEDCIRFIEGFAEAGVSLPILLPYGGDINAVLEVGVEYARRER